MSSFAAEIQVDEERRERARAAMRAMPTNSPFHQPVAPAPVLQGRALEEAQAWAQLTAAQRYARTRPVRQDFQNDPDVVCLRNESGGGMIYKHRVTGQILGELR